MLVLGKKHSKEVFEEKTFKEIEESCILNVEPVQTSFLPNNLYNFGFSDIFSINKTVDSDKPKFKNGG